MADAINGSYFHQHCDVCDKSTWHYKSKGHAPAHCCVHSNNLVGRYEPPPIKQKKHVQVTNKLDRSLWRNAEESSARVCIADHEWAQDLFSASAPMKDPNKLYCSFCDAEVDRINVATEKKPKILWKQDAYKDASGEVIMEEKRITQMETVHACPNCVVKIRKPIVVHRI